MPAVGSVGTAAAESADGTALSCRPCREPRDAVTPWLSCRAGRKAAAVPPRNLSSRERSQWSLVVSSSASSVAQPARSSEVSSRWKADLVSGRKTSTTTTRRKRRFSDLPTGILEI